MSLCNTELEGHNTPSCQKLTDLDPVLSESSSVPHREFRFVLQLLKSPTVTMEAVCSRPGVSDPCLNRSYQMQLSPNRPFLLRNCSMQGRLCLCCCHQDCSSVTASPVTMCPRICFSCVSCAADGKKAAQCCLCSAHSGDKAERRTSE